MICAYENCKKEFEPIDGRQKYCCKECKDKAKRLRFGFATSMKAETKVVENCCDRFDCRFYQMNLSNHCNALVEVDKDTYKCKFYKERR